MSFQTVSNTSVSGNVITGVATAASTSTGGFLNVNISDSTTTWEAPANIQSVLEKYFELKGDVASNPKEFMEAIDQLPGVDDNFKAIKLYDLLKKGKHKEFKEFAKKYQQEGMSGYSFANDTDTGIYVSGSDQITLTTSGTANVTGVAV